MARCYKDADGHGRYFDEKQEITEDEFNRLYPKKKCLPWCEIDEKGQKIYHASTGRIASLKQMKAWYADFDENDCRANLIGMVHAKKSEKTRVMKDLTERQKERLKEGITALDKAQDKEQIIRDLSIALEACRRDNKDCVEKLATRSLEANEKLSEKDVIIRECLTREQSIQSRLAELQDQCQGYKDTMEEMRRSGGISKEVAEEMKKRIEELSSLQSACIEREEKMKAEEAIMHMRLDEAEKKIQSAGDICFASAENARDCLAKIRDLYPGLAGLVVQDNKITSAILTDGTSMVAPKGIPIPPPLINISKMETSEPGATVVPVRPTQMPSEGTSDRIPMPPPMVKDMFAEMSEKKLKETKPKQKIEDKDFLKEIKAGKKLKKVEIEEEEKQPVTSMNAQQQLMASIRARGSRKMSDEDMSRLESKTKLKPISTLPTLDPNMAKILARRSAISDDEDTEDEWE